MADKESVIEEIVDRWKVDKMELSDDQLDETAWITKDVLEIMLKNNKIADEIIVTDFKINLLIPPGENLSSTVYRLCIFYKDPKKEKEICLVLKSSQDEQTLIGERDFYENALPIMMEIFQHRTELHEIAAIAPKYFKHPKANVLFLEEICRLKMLNRKVGFSLPQIKLVIKYLAKFHAMSLGWLEQDPSIPKKLSTETFFREENRDTVEGYFVRPIDVLIEEIGSWAGYERFQEKLLRFQGRIVDILSRSKRSDIANLYAAIHGDCWLNNILMDEEKEEVIMVDFQHFQWAPAVEDVAHVLYFSSRRSIREKYSEEILKLYFHELHRWLTLMKLKTKITWESIQKDFHAIKEVSIVIPLCFLQMHLLPEGYDNLRISSLFKDDIKDPNSAWRKAYRNEEYIKEMKELLEEADKDGIFGKC